MAEEPDPEARADFAILGYAITSMERNVYPTAGEILLGPEASDEQQARTSIDKLVRAAASPMFLWHAAEDAYVPATETYRVAVALTRARVPHTTHVFAHGPHSLGIARGAGDAETWTALAEAWLRGLP